MNQSESASREEKPSVVKDKPIETPDAARPESIRVGKGAVLYADIRSPGRLEIFGVLKGSAECAEVLVHPEGRVEGTVCAGLALIRGAVDGDVEADSLELKEGSTVSGAISYAKDLVVDKGAEVTSAITRVTNSLFQTPGEVKRTGKAREKEGNRRRARELSLASDPFGSLGTGGSDDGNSRANEKKKGGFGFLRRFSSSPTLSRRVEPSPIFGELAGKNDADDTLDLKAETLPQKPDAEKEETYEQFVLEGSRFQPPVPPDHPAKSAQRSEQFRAERAARGED